jgi:hypothetical protein
LNEANTDRNNGNRVFDSQNNAQGGYCLGPSMTFYAQSMLSIEWTNQHGCANPKMSCNIVIQYMCSTNNADPTVRVRDGTTTDTITNAATGPTATDANGNLLYGMHENFVYYTACTVRNRNQGLFIADRETQGGLNTNQAAAIFTRQNNNGDRHGYECPEERDYYPYWAPSPWKDIAVLSDSVSYCSFYQSQSQNVAPRYYCADANGVQLPPITQVACTAAKGTWTLVGAFNIPAPVCIQAPWTRNNYLGNGNGAPGYTNSYNWTLPSAQTEPCIGTSNCACVLRMRYNISTSDLGSNGNSPVSGFIDFASNNDASPVTEDMYITQAGATLQLALDTTQYGRTFQDRSYVFGINPRPNNVSPLARIFNLNVRGKRGNIVQTYPATEYDFVPEMLHTRVGDFVHFQWTGCDTNPAGNAGEGTDQTDRSNIVQLPSMGVNIPVNDTFHTANPTLSMFDSSSTRFLFSYLGQTNCLTEAQLLAKNNNNAGTAQQDPQNCMKLNAASPYFNGGLQAMNKTGTFYYMSSRNNNFTNRGQKAVLITDSLLPTFGIVLVSIGSFTFVAAGALGGAMFYAKSHPTSKVASLLNRIPNF